MRDAGVPSLRYYYLGFYIHTCHRMQYKVRGWGRLGGLRGEGDAPPLIPHICACMLDAPHFIERCSPR